MTPEPTADNTPGPLPAQAPSATPEKTPPSTAGMTTKVVKGSMWALVGQVAPLAISFVTTPFVIRILGAESYGVLVLIGILPSYLGFADFGMSFASTRFASEAYAENDEVKEGRVISSAAIVALSTTLPIATLLLFFASDIVEIFRTPEHLIGEATLALRISGVTFVFNILSGIVNSPQAARLRMDISMFVNIIPRIAGLIATPVVLYLGFGIVGAVSVLALASFFVLLGHFYFSRRLLPKLESFPFDLDRQLIIPLIRFGSGLAVSVMAGLLLINAEKLVLVRVTSVEALAYYSVAFTFASMAAMLSGSMMQSLIPAFTQLLKLNQLEQLRDLYSRAAKANILIMLPGIACIFVLSRPLFSLWAGPDFGYESSPPAYILSIGIFFNVLAFVPASLLVAKGRTGLLAWLQWFELAPYLLLATILALRFGAVGVAIAWSIRTFIDACMLTWFAKRSLGRALRLNTSRIEIKSMFVGSGALLVPTILSILLYDLLSIHIGVLLLCLVGYAVIMWRGFLVQEERNWILSYLWIVRTGR